MKTFVCAGLFASAVMAGGAAETDLPWQFDWTDRQGAFAPPVAATVEVASDAVWACPAWIEVFVSGSAPLGALFILR